MSAIGSSLTPASLSSVSPKLKLGFAMTGNFGGVENYDDRWVGRYYVQETKLVGLSFLPSIAYKVTDKLSSGAGVNVMNGIYKNQESPIRPFDP